MKFLRDIRLAPFFKHMLLLVVMLVCPFRGLSQLYLNGKSVFADSVSNMLLYSIPKECFGGSFTAVVQADTTCGWHNITVNGMPLTGNPVTFANIGAGKAFMVRAIKDRKPIVKRLMFTYLPIMSIECNVGYDFSGGNITLMTPDGNVDEAMTALVKWRGGYTNREGRHKRNYSIKFVDANGEKQNRRLLGMRRDNHWKLDAAQVDLSRVRNRVATDLWLDMAHPPYYYEQAPDVLTGARGEMLEVFVDGKYMGIYSLSECIDRKQLQVKKYDEQTGTFHGMIWNVVSWSKMAEFVTLEGYNNNSPNYHSFMIEYPEFEDVHPTNHVDLYNTIRFMAYGNINTYNEHVHEYFDMPVIIDYAIFLQLLIAVDNGVNNIYWAIYDREVDKRLTLAVWDLDWSLGTNRDSPDFRGGRAEPNYDFRYSSLEFRRLTEPKCIYHNAMINRYWELRKTWLSEESLANRVNRIIDNLIGCGAVAREEARWSGDSDINGLKLDINAERLYLIDWIKKRLAHLDRTLMRHPCDVNCDGFVTCADVTMLNSFFMDGSWADYPLDINGDGYVTSADITAFYDYYFSR